MNFDKFKKLKPRSITPPRDSESYSKELLSLKSRPSSAKTLSIISTVAAAIIIVSLVAVWAIIGRGIQQTPPPSTPPSDSTQQSTTLIKDESITASQRTEFFDMFAKYRIDAMPVFSEEQMPDISEMGWYIAHLNQSDLNGGTIPRNIFEREVERLFGFDYKVEQEEIELGDGEFKEYPFAELIEYKTEQTENGTLVCATAAVYYMWNLYEQNCDILYPAEFAIAKGTVTAGNGNIDDISGIYEIKYLSDDGITPSKFLSLEKYTSPSDEYYEFFETK